jgi:type II secretion system (T2SS) protein G
VKQASLWIVCVALAGCGAKETMDKLQESKRNLAKVAANKIAVEAYPSWSMAHPDKQCPAKIDELAEYLGDKMLVDPWGHPYRFYCGPAAPPGVKGAGAMSLGPDGEEGTADDIKSWDP